MDRPCPSCDEPLAPLVGDEMGSAPPVRYRCVGCELTYERDTSGPFAEVEWNGILRSGALLAL